MKAEQRCLRNEACERVQGLHRLDTVALRADTDAVQQDVGLVGRRGILRLAQHHLEAVGQRNLGTVVGHVNADRRDRQQPITRRIEAAGFDVEHHPAPRVGWRARPACGETPQPARRGHR